MDSGSGGTPVELIEVEAELFTSSSEIPTWGSVNRAREILRLYLEETSRLAPLPLAVGEEISHLPAEEARRIAALRLGAIAMRSAGSVVALIRCGYVPESRAQLRRLVEAAIRAYAVLDDKSGEHARAWLLGRPIKKMSRLLRHYRHPGLANGLAVMAHADSEGLNALIYETEGQVFVDLAPQRQKELADVVLRETIMMILLATSSLATVFDDYLPPYKSASEVVKLRIDLGLRPLPPSGYRDLSRVATVLGVSPSELLNHLWLNPQEREG